MPFGATAPGGKPSAAIAPSRDEERVRRGFWRKAKRVAARLPFAEDLLAAYYCAFDRATPLQVKAALIGALAYFVLPFDCVPDFLPLLGFTDDAAVLVGDAAHGRRQHPPRASRGRARGIGADEAAAVGASRPHHQLAHHLAVGERLERLRRLRERIDLLHVAGELALRAPMREPVDARPCRRPCRAAPTAPQNTPSTAQPLSSTRLSGSFGISPAAKPTTRWRPSQASERTAGSL